MAMATITALKQVSVTNMDTRKKAKVKQFTFQRRKSQRWA